MSKVIETDFEPGMSSWAHNVTRERVTDAPSYPFAKEWAEEHGWYWDSDILTDLINNTGSDTVFCWRCS